MAPGKPSLRRLETIVNVTLAEQRGKALIGLRDPYLLVFLPTVPEQGNIDAAMALAAHIHNAARRESPRAALAHRHQHRRRRAGRLAGRLCRSAASDGSGRAPA